MILQNLFSALPELRKYHMRDCPTYLLLEEIARREVEDLFSSPDSKSHPFPPFGDLTFPYFEMGAVNSLNLFDLDELILFSFYWHNRDRYAIVADVGANIGLHTVLLSKCGFQVVAYEPDPVHVARLKENAELNQCTNIEIINKAVSNHEGEMEFIRVLGNTTGSHLAASKAKPYGELERFPVKLANAKSVFSRADLIKMDAEGHEKEIILATDDEDWNGTDCLLEIENAENAEIVFDHLLGLQVNMFAQKIGWEQVNYAHEVPIRYSEGMLFATRSESMPWL